MRFSISILFLAVNLHCAIQVLGSPIKTWEEFKVEFKKSYSSAEEETLRRENFLHSFKWIEENRGKNGLEFEINQFADLVYRFYIV